MSGDTVKIEGFEDLGAGFDELKAPTGKALARRVMKVALQPVADRMRDNARQRSGLLKRSITVGTQLSRSQRSEARETASYVEMYVGPAGKRGQPPEAITEEFGTKNEQGHPFARPAWEAESGATLERFTQEMRTEVDKAAARAARKAARLARS